MEILSGLQVIDSPISTRSTTGVTSNDPSESNIILKPQRRSSASAVVIPASPGLLDDGKQMNFENPALIAHDNILSPNLVSSRTSNRGLNPLSPVDSHNHKAEFPPAALRCDKVYSKLSEDGIDVSNCRTPHTFKLDPNDLRRTITRRSAKRSEEIKRVEEAGSRSLFEKLQLNESESDPCMRLVASINASLERSALVNSFNFDTSPSPAADDRNKKSGVIESLQQVNDLLSWFDAIESRLNELQSQLDCECTSRCERLLTLDCLLSKLCEKMPLVSGLQEKRRELFAHSPPSSGLARYEEQCGSLETRWRALTDRLQSSMLLAGKTKSAGDFDTAVLNDIEADVAAFAAWIEGVEQSHFVPFREYVRTSVNLHELKIVAKEQDAGLDRPMQLPMEPLEMNLETVLATHQSLQNEIEARSRFITAVLKVCEMFERRSFLMQREQKENVDAGGSDQSDRLDALKQSVASLENGLHQKWLESLEFKFLIEQLLALSDTKRKPGPGLVRVAKGRRSAPVRQPEIHVNRASESCSGLDEMERESDDTGAQAMQFQLELESGPLVYASTPSGFASRPRKRIVKPITTRGSPKRNQAEVDWERTQLNCTWPPDNEESYSSSSAQKSLGRLFDHSENSSPSNSARASCFRSGSRTPAWLASSLTNRRRNTDANSLTLQSSCSTSPSPYLAAIGRLTESHQVAANRYYVMTNMTGDSDSELPCGNGEKQDDDACLESVMERIAEAYANGTPRSNGCQRNRQDFDPESKNGNAMGLSESVESKSTRQLIEEVEHLVTPNSSVIEPCNGSDGSEGDQFDRAEYAMKAVTGSPDEAAGDLMWDHFIIPPHGSVSQHGPSSDEEEAVARARADRFVHQMWDVELTAGANGLPLASHSAALLSLTATRRASLGIRRLELDNNNDDDQTRAKERFELSLRSDEERISPNSVRSKRANDRRRAERLFELRMKAQILASRRKELQQLHDPVAASVGSSPVKPDFAIFRSASASTSPNVTPKRRGRRLVRRSPTRTMQIRRALFDDGTTSGRDCETATEDGRQKTEDDKDSDSSEKSSIASLKLKSKVGAAKTQSAAGKANAVPNAHDESLRKFTDGLLDAEHNWSLLRAQLADSLMQQIGSGNMQRGERQIAAIRAKLDEATLVVQQQLRSVERLNTEFKHDESNESSREVQEATTEHMAKWTRLNGDLNAVAQSTNRFMNLLQTARSMHENYEQAAAEDDVNADLSASLAHLIRDLNTEPLRWGVDVHDNSGRSSASTDRDSALPDDWSAQASPLGGLSEIGKAVQSAISALKASVDQQNASRDPADDELLRAVSMQLSRMLLSEFAELYARIAASRERLVALVTSLEKSVAVAETGSDASMSARKVYVDEATTVETNELLQRRSVATNAAQTDVVDEPLPVQAPAGNRRWLTRYSKMCVIVFGCLLGLTLCLTLAHSGEPDDHSCEYSAIRDLRSRLSIESRQPPV